MPSPRTLQDKQDEKDRLAKAYRAYKRRQWAGLIEKEPRLIEFQKTLKKADNPADILRRLSQSWIMAAPNDVRYAALRLIDAHANKMVRQLGGEALSDPMPPAKNLFIAARELLRVR